MNTIPLVRPSPISGTWYSDDAEILSKQIRTYLERVPARGYPADIKSILVPHAGHRYSGQTAAYGFKAIAGREYDVVAVLSPLHDYQPHPFLSSAYAFYETPLGRVEVDHRDLDWLQRELNSELVLMRSDREHSIEIQLPFLQTVLKPGFTLIPLMIRTRVWDEIQQLGEVLARLAECKRLLLVSSSDLSHFYSSASALSYDSEVLKRLSAMKPLSLLNVEDEGAGFACGISGMTAVLEASIHLGADAVEVLHQSDSSAVTGDKTSVVGYASAMIYRSAQ